MTISFSAPGVYFREVEVAPPTPLPVSVTAFVGQAERGPLDAPQLLTNWGQFGDVFGGFTGFSYLAYAVFGFFQNGGSRCYVVRVAHETAQAGRQVLRDQANAEIIEVTAINAGQWSDALRIAVEPSSGGAVLLTTLASPVAQNQTTVALRSTAGLAPGDLLTLVHTREPRQQTLRAASIDHAAHAVTFAAAVGQGGFPAGSGVMGRGFKLVVRYAPAGRLLREEVYDNLSLDRNHPRYFVKVINGEPEEPDYVLRMEKGLSVLIRVEDLPGQVAGSRPAAAAAGLADGSDGSRQLSAPYYTGYLNGAPFRPLPPSPSPAKVQAVQEKLFGLAASERIGEIGLVASPDLILPDLYASVPDAEIPPEGILFARLTERTIQADHLRTGQRDLLEHCARMGDRLAILDSPLGARPGKGAKIEDWPDNFSLLPVARYGGLYYPWIKERLADFEGRSLVIPPCGHVAGIYARTESARGPGKAPANELVEGVVDLEYCVDDAEQGLLNPRAVNCIRVLPGRGIRVWGARTLDPDPQQRYVNVRRIVQFIVKNILANLQWAVFEPNGRSLWNRMAATLTQFLNGLYQQGVLAGAQRQDAFFVRCDETTNTPDLLDRGEVLAVVGFAPARPAEFIVVTVKRTAGALSVAEATRPGV